MSFKVTKYKNMEIHYVNAKYKYDVYKGKKWYSSFNTLKDVKNYIEYVNNNGYVPF